MARMGPSSLDPWRLAMGWSEVAARSHARRLEREGWLGRVAMAPGEGSLFWATRLGVRVAAVDVYGVGERSAGKWAHDVGCAWTAAWAMTRGHRVIGARELLVEREWSDVLEWADRYGPRRSGHRPDLLAFVRDAEWPVAIEVELAPKSNARLKAILGLHQRWIREGRTTGVTYVCGDEAGCRRIAARGREVGLGPAWGLRLKTLADIKAQTLEQGERLRQERTTRSSVAE